MSRILRDCTEEDQVPQVSISGPTFCSGLQTRVLNTRRRKATKWKNEVDSQTPSFQSKCCPCPVTVFQMPPITTTILCCCAYKEKQSPRLMMRIEDHMIGHNKMVTVAFKFRNKDNCNSVKAFKESWHSNQVKWWEFSLSNPIYFSFNSISVSTLWHELYQK